MVSIRLAKGGLELQKGTNTNFISIRLKVINLREKHEVELKSHLQKLLNGLHHPNLLPYQWIVFDPIKGSVP